jgi:hypothetical protein
MSNFTIHTIYNQYVFTLCPWNTHETTDLIRYPRFSRRWNESGDLAGQIQTADNYEELNKDEKNISAIL